MMGLRRAWPVARLVTRQRVVLRFDQGAGAELGNAEYQRQLARGGYCRRVRGLGNEGYINFRQTTTPSGCDFYRLRSDDATAIHRATLMVEVGWVGHLARPRRCGR
jgi:hypothetical protein